MVSKMQKISVSAPNSQILKLRIRGLTDLISHRLDPEVVVQMTARETGAQVIKKLRDFDEEFKACFHLIQGERSELPDNSKGMPEGFEIGFPSMAFSRGLAYITADYGKEISKAMLNRNLAILSERIVPLTFDSYERVIDIPRRSGMTRAPDVRHRPYIKGWSCELIVRFDADILSAEAVVNLFARAGSSAGIGDWRPSSPKSAGNHGLYEVAEVLGEGE